jgi:hypothetical protein
VRRRLFLSERLKRPSGVEFTIAGWQIISGAAKPQFRIRFNEN